MPETPSAKYREGHELTHFPTEPWCSVCVRANGVDERHLRRPAGECAQDQGVGYMPVVQYDYAYVSSGYAEGQQVKMRTILDTSTDYGTACVIDVKGAGDMYAIASAVSFLKELGCARLDAGRTPSQRSKHTWIQPFSGWQGVAQSSMSGHSLLQRQIRALRFDIEERFGTVVGVADQKQVQFFASYSKKKKFNSLSHILRNKV